MVSPHSFLEFDSLAAPSTIAAWRILDSLPDGVYITDRERRIVYWNAAAERITGWSAAEVKGRSCFANLLQHLDKDGHCLCGHEHCPLHRSIVTEVESASPVLVFARHKRGGRVPMEVSVAPLRDRDGVVVGGVEVFRDLSEMQHDLLRAKEVQEMALRCALPEDPRLRWGVLYQASEVVGGDFYRIERLGPDVYALLVADAMGHGVAAALHTMLLRSLWDDHRAELSSPAALLRVLNARVQPMVRGQGYFGTAVAVVYDAASGRLRCARAGHPAPLVFRGDGVRVDAIGESGPGLGLLPECEYEEAEAGLEPGDSLLLFSDGAEEAPGAGGAELGVAGLVRLVQAQLAQPGGQVNLAALEESVLRHVGSVRLPDDLTLVSLQRPLQ